MSSTLEFDASTEIYIEMRELEKGEQAGRGEETHAREINLLTEAGRGFLEENWIACADIANNPRDKPVSKGYLETNLQSLDTNPNETPVNPYSIQRTQ